MRARVVIGVGAGMRAGVAAGRGRWVSKPKTLLPCLVRSLSGSRVRVKGAMEVRVRVSIRDIGN